MTLERGTEGWDAQIAARLDAGDRVTVTFETPSMSPREMAESMGVSRAAVQRWIAEGRVRTTRRGTYHQIELSEVERFRGEYLDHMSAAIADEVDEELFGSKG